MEVKGKSGFLRCYQGSAECYGSLALFHLGFSRAENSVLDENPFYIFSWGHFAVRFV